MVRNTEMTLRHQLYTAARLLANEQAVNRVLRRHLEESMANDPYHVEYDTNPTVIVDHDRIDDAADLIERTAEL